MKERNKAGETETQRFPEAVGVKRERGADPGRGPQSRMLGCGTGAWGACSSLLQLLKSENI